MGFMKRLRSLLVPDLWRAVPSDAAGPLRDPLEGCRFDGVVLECGKTAGDADTLIFKGGRFRSTACDRYEYGDGPYTANMSGDAVTFAAETESPKYGKLHWRGVVRGRRLDGTLTMVRDGQIVIEKWVLAGQTA